jgi:hypothetical protein
MATTEASVWRDLALVGVGGLVSLVAALFTTWTADKRKELRRSRALWGTVESDLVRWSSMLQVAADQARITGDLDVKLKWPDVAGELSLYLPNRLYYLVEQAYFNRDVAEAAFRERIKHPGTALEMEAAQVELRRWALFAAGVLKVADDYFGRSVMDRVRRRGRLTQRDVTLNSRFVSVMYDRIAKILRDEYKHDVDEHGAFVPTSDSAEREIQLMNVDIERDRQHRTRPAGG